MKPAAACCLGQSCSSFWRIIINYPECVLDNTEHAFGLGRPECIVPSYSDGWQKHDPKRDMGPNVDRGWAQVLWTSNYILSSEWSACQSQSE